MENWPELITFNQDYMRLIAHLAKPWLIVGIMYIVIFLLTRWRNRQEEEDGENKQLKGDEISETETN